jgi:cytochrome b involved in lipid metabolism
VLKKISKFMPVFTVAQVGEHNNSSDVWVIIHNKVYDLTAFLDDHPGKNRLKQAARRFL